MSLITPGRNLVLIGLMGAGKTTVGRVVAAELGRPFVDTDDFIELDAGRSIAQIFATEGERAFRRHEAAAIRQVSAVRGQVIAVGGGAVLDPANVTQLRATGDLVLLDATVDELADRLDDDGTRPLLEGADVAERLAALRAERDGVYRAAAGFVVDTDGRTPAEVATLVLEWAQRRPGLLAADEKTA